FKHAVLLHQAEKYAEALKVLDVAARLADGPEQAEAVLEEQIKNYQASHTLAEVVNGLGKRLEAGGKGAAADWRRLARLLEVEQKLPEATVAIKTALGLDPKSVPSWTVAARLHESAGDLGAAVLARRKLAELD